MLKQSADGRGPAAFFGRAGSRRSQLQQHDTKFDRVGSQKHYIGMQKLIANIHCVEEGRVKITCCAGSVIFEADIEAVEGRQVVVQSQEVVMSHLQAAVPARQVAGYMDIDIQMYNPGEVEVVQQCCGKQCH